MKFATPAHSRRAVDRAGTILAGNQPSRLIEQALAYDVLENWGASHAYPVNTFQATLRDKVKRIDPDAIIAQRLKRTPSIVAKLRRFHQMKLSKMQDIGGLCDSPRLSAADLSADDVFSLPPDRCAWSSLRSSWDRLSAPMNCPSASEDLSR